MKIRVTRSLVEKQVDEDGTEWCELEAFSEDLDVSVRVNHWNERFFEVITTRLLVEPGDVLSMFDGMDDGLDG